MHIGMHYRDEVSYWGKTSNVPAEKGCPLCISGTYHTWLLTSGQNISPYPRWRLVNDSRCQQPRFSHHHHHRHTDIVLWSLVEKHVFFYRIDRAMGTGHPGDMWEKEVTVCRLSGRMPRERLESNNLPGRSRLSWLVGHSTNCFLKDICVMSAKANRVIKDLSEEAEKKWHDLG